MESLQEAILRPNIRENYLHGFPEEVRTRLASLITEVSGTLHFQVSNTSHQILEDKLQQGERAYSEVDESNPMDSHHLRRLNQLGRNTTLAIHQLFPEAFEPVQFRADNLWAMQFRQEMQLLLNTLSPARRVTVVGDREIHNLHGIIDYANTNPDSLQLSGVVTPFYDLDSRIVNALRRIPDIQEYGCTHIAPDESGDLYAEGPLHGGISYTHVPYTTSKKQRRRYCEEKFLPAVLSTKPDIVFMANWKLILDEIVPETLEKLGILLVNVHPSILPLNKGWRTELMALQGINADASGFTYHIATKELDAGATLYAYHYPAIPYLEKQASGPGGSCYSDREEQRMRQMMIRAQEYLTPRVLDYATRPIDHTIVRNDMAFGAELRARPDKFNGQYNCMLFR